MALCLRYFDHTTKSVREDFISFTECEATTGESVSEAFLANWRKACVDIVKMRGPGYDGASNMSGKFRGVQARIRQIIPDAMYTHCKAHCLNLAIIHASQEPLAKNMMNTVQEVAFLFNYSCKRLLRFQETSANDQVSREQMENRTKLQSLCETRWAARADELNTFKCSYTTIVDSLDDLNLH
ncbi:zinc finger MYM-type protein 1-like [Mya arenaria]|uniref:zinc finger MYM-type protein 1-like n=1 Tax=Mya arenaria TaxID=6604 RepID=UPI0022E3245B|nr:zinc finger MYM-type protein 1-like [Mya arenaria]